MNPKDTYVRKISAGEANEQSVFITKDAWGFFPSPGTPFPLETSEGTIPVRLVTVPCQCVGPLHEHYHLKGPLPFALVKGDFVQIRKGPAGAYRLSWARRPVELDS